MNLFLSSKYCYTFINFSVYLFVESVNPVTKFHQNVKKCTGKIHPAATILI